MNWVQNANLADDGWYPETAAGVPDRSCRFR